MHRRRIMRDIMMMGGVKVAPWYIRGDVTPANCILAYQPKGAASEAGAKVNLANPGVYNAGDSIPADDPSWDPVNGWIFTGTEHLASACPASTKPVSMIARVARTASAGDRCIFGMGSNNGIGGWEVRVKNATDKIEFLKAQTALVGASTTGLGTDSVTAVTYSATGDYIFYLNGIADGNGNNDQAPVASTLAIGSGYPFGELDPFIGKIYAMAIYNVVLTPAQVLAISAGMASLP